jgi:hypothetical protein
MMWHSPGLGRWPMQGRVSAPSCLLRPALFLVRVLLVPVTLNPSDLNRISHEVTLWRRPSP